MLKLISIIFLIFGCIIIGIAFFIAKKENLKELLSESSKLQIDTYVIEEDNSITELYDDMSSMDNSSNFQNQEEDDSSYKEENIISNEKSKETEILKEDTETELLNNEKKQPQIEYKEEETELLFTEDEVTELLGK